MENKIIKKDEKCTLITENNGKKKLNFDEKGRFCKGNTISKGKRKRTQIGKLTVVLKKEESHLGKASINIIRQGVSVQSQAINFA